MRENGKKAAASGREEIQVDKALYDNHLSILRSELVVALGCTEPIAIAYAAAKARELLGELPEHCVCYCSGNIVKNVMGVTVPNSGGLKGIDVAALLGVVGGKADQELAVLDGITDEDRAKVREMLRDKVCECKLIENVATLYIVVELRAGEHSALVEIQNTHRNITRMMKDGKEIFRKEAENAEEKKEHGDKSLLTVDNIIEFADAVSAEELEPVIGPQIEHNMAICREGLEHPYGAQVGRILIEGNDHPTVGLKSRAYAAAGSDARMNGCPMPVVINSGSGNQGMTASIPVVVYAKELNSGADKMYRALALSNLTAIHQKTRIGRLSAYCGAVSAGAGAGAGIAYLCGGGYDEVVHTVVNALAVVSGIVCDGAKASCAAKIASAVDAGILGYNMYVRGQQFYGGDGIVTKGVEATIANVGRLGKDGMKATNEEIIRIMVGDKSLC